MVGGLLQRLGVVLPGQLIPGDEHNPDGYHEWEQVVQLQEQLLRDLQRFWPSQNGLLPLPADWLWRPETARTRAQLLALLSRELPLKPGPWAIKDPRTTLLLPLWRQLAEELQLELRLVLCLRDPAEVLVSLCRRDGPLVGMTPQRARMLWWHHHRRLLLDRGQLPTLVLRHGDWFSSTRACEQLSALARFASLNEPTTQTSQRILQRIQPTYRRSLAAAQHHRLRREVTPELVHLWHALCRAELAPPGADLPRQPAGRGARCCWRLGQALLRHQPGMPGMQRWFCPDHYREQLPELDPATDPFWHYCHRGWRSGLAPHPLFDPSFYRSQSAKAGSGVRGNPLRHFLRWGVRRACSPSPLFLQCDGALVSGPPSLAQVHPRGAEALDCTGGDERLAVAWLLRDQHGGSAAVRT